MNHGRRIARAILAVVVVLAAARLAALAHRFGAESVQADFSAFYTAGQAARAGLSPYWTAPDHDPPLWDGVSLYYPSRFLYPPLAASLFAPLTHVGYATAKSVWMAVTLLALAGAMAVFVRALRGRLTVESGLGLAAFACLFQPLVLHLERGQVDALTLLAVALALRPMVADGRDTLTSGLLLALGSVLKPNVAGLLPFLVLRRRWRALAGFGAGAAVAVLATLALHGREGLAAYVTRELPRISREGEAHGDDDRLPPAVLARLRAGAPEGMTARDGRLYRIEAFRFVTNASLARPLKRRLGLRLGPSRLSLLLLAAFGAVVGLWQLREGGALVTASPLRELAYWQAAMAAVLLAWPVTWAMNGVWLLPAAIIVAAAGWHARTAAARGTLIVCTFGLLLAAIPDEIAATALGATARLKYVAAELLVFASMLFGLRHLPEDGHGQGERGDTRGVDERLPARGSGARRDQ